MFKGTLSRSLLVSTTKSAFQSRLSKSDHPAKGSLSAMNLSPALARPGHQPSVVVTFRFQEMSPAPIRLSGRFTAANLSPAFAQPGHLLSVAGSSG